MFSLSIILEVKTNDSFSALIILLLLDFKAEKGIYTSTIIILSIESTTAIGIIIKAHFGLSD